MDLATIPFFRLCSLSSFLAELDTPDNLPGGEKDCVFNPQTAFT